MLAIVTLLGNAVGTVESNNYVRETLARTQT